MHKHPAPSKPSQTEAFELYESGKHRRYSLLITVNGGAFAIAGYSLAPATRWALEL